MSDASHTDPHSSDIERETRRALIAGWRRRCPSCETGPMMQGYLTVREHCAVCGEALHHHRADDGPAWATILIAGHLMAPIMLSVFMAYRPAGWVMAIGFSTVFVVLSLYLLPRLKGALVAFQWARRMHGFGGDP